MEFPQFRKYKNGQSYFRVNSNSSFIEYKLNGNRIEKHTFEVKILPDRNYLNDMLYSFENHWDRLSDSEWKTFLASRNIEE